LSIINTFLFFKHKFGNLIIDHLVDDHNISNSIKIICSASKKTLLLDQNHFKKIC
jgi:hypothetical protein